MTDYTRHLNCSAALAAFLLLLTTLAANAQPLAPGETLHMGFEDQSEILVDFVSQNEHYANQDDKGLAERVLSIGEGRFGNGLYIEDGSPKSAGTWNQSGLDCDLIVSVVWGEWRKKPHYWGAGHFYGDRGTVAFWVKGEAAHRGVIFMQGSIGWGRKERDLFTVEVDQDGRLNAHLRDVNSVYHRVQAEQPTWKDGEWEHVAVTYDRAYGMKLYHNGVLVGSSWGQDAWWQAPLPGLFSPFLQQSRYDEIRMFDYPLDEVEVAKLFQSNEAPAAPAHRDGTIEPEAAMRLLALYGDLVALDLPVIKAGEGTLPMRQSLVESCTDERIPVSFVNDGRYELAWPAPYRLFTFVLGDADFHGENIEVKLAPGEKPNYISFEGTLSGLDVRYMSMRERAQAAYRGLLPNPNEPPAHDGKPILKLDTYDPFFYAQKLDLKGDGQFKIPLVKEYGLPEDLEGSVKMPLTGPTRIHEMQLWEVGGAAAAPDARDARVEFLAAPVALADIPRYGSALEKLDGGLQQVVLPALPTAGAPVEVPMAPLQAFHLLSAAPPAPEAVTAIRLHLRVKPKAPSDVLWVKLRDPGDPSRFWSQACVRVDYGSTAGTREIDLMLDVVDLLLVPEDRLLVELTFASGGTLVLGGPGGPSSLAVYATANRKDSLAQYARHALLPARMQYMKEYNYRPWLFTGNTITVDDWEVFGGPYDMAYPPLAVLRQDPDNEMANRYKTLLFDRTWFGSIEPGDPVRPLRFEEPANAPAWANAERELLALNWDVVDWIVANQRHNGMFWGGPNDDSFFPLGWAALPFLGHEGARKAWLRFYDGEEAMGIYNDGYCDIWPIDPLHITDFICSRGLMLSYALGDPQVFERELRTSEQYNERVTSANAERAKKGLPPLTGDRQKRDEEQGALTEQMDAEILNYSRAQIGWWWGETETRPPHEITDRAAVAEQMLDAYNKADDLAVFGFTEAHVHTDNQRGIGRDVLISTALGGRVQGYTEPFPPSIAVSWEDADTPDLARLVSYADDSRLVVNCYNFGEAPLKSAMRVFRLQPGVYELATGADADDDGVIDENAKQEKSTVALRRFSTIPLEIPPGQNMVVSLNLANAEERPAELPDLAVTARDIVVRGDQVEVTVHNIGALPAENVRVALLDGAGDVVAEKVIPRLDSPRQTLAAQHVALALYVKRAAGPLRVVVDPGNEIDEQFEENNGAERKLRTVAQAFADAFRPSPATRGERPERIAEEISDPKVAEAVHQMKLFETALVAYKIKFRKFPKKLDGLVNPPSGESILRDPAIPLDPWGNAYEFRLEPNGRKYLITCRTTDGLEIRSDGYPDLSE